MISIVTINYNNKQGLEKTLQSAIDQRFDDYEHIVIDGNSTDGSKGVLTAYSNYLSYSISEPDTGVYNAMNKGIRQAKGDYTLFLNSGDTLAHNEILKEVSTQMVDGLDLYYGDLNFVSPDGSHVQTYPDELSFKYFYHRSLGHPATFIKRSLFDKIFYYNEDLKIVSDWEFFICAVCKYNVSYRHLDLVISNFETDGMSSDEANKKVIASEMKSVLDNQFAFFMDDLRRLEKLEKDNQILKSNRFKMSAELENSKWARKINSLLLRIQLRLFRNKKIDDL